MLNITNGDYFNEYFKKNINPCAVPFREAIMQGDATAKVFSDDFVLARSKSLGVSKEKYLEYAKDLLREFERLNQIEKIELWFGMDTFCQLNVLTLLAYLEQRNYSGKVFLNFIDDETFAVVGEKVEVKLGLYEQIYFDAVVNKRTPKEYGVLDKGAIDLYFDFLSPSGQLAKIVLNGANEPRQDIVIKLINESKDYGLSDLLAEELIDRVLGKK